MRAFLVLVVGSLVVPLLAAGMLQFARGPIIAWFPPGTALQASNAIGYVLDVSVWYAVANLLPVPPLSGGHVLLALVPALEPRLRTLLPWSRIGLAVAFVLGAPYLPRLLA
ncbi:MAG: hypothetical protein IPK28_22615 [Devosia sp.]|nr:hypothetical protein [Devosia sp.]